MILEMAGLLSWEGAVKNIAYKKKDQGFIKNPKVLFLC